MKESITKQKNKNIIMSSIQEKLEQRHQERLEKFEERRKQLIKEKNDTSETSDVFLLAFNKEKREILNIFHNVNEKSTRDEIRIAFEKISQKMLTLHKYISDSAVFLPSYDIRRAQEIMTQLREDLTNKREVLLPKKKFAFKSRQKISSKDTSAEKIESKDNSNLINSNDVIGFGFDNRTGEELSLTREESNSKDINLSNLENCTINIYGSPSAMRLKNVINSRINCGPVSRAIFINDCFDSTFQLACQQLRIHSTSNTKFYIHVTSKAIIEDSNEVGFGAYSWTYEGVKSDFEHSGLNQNTNNWKDVDDFNWLKLDEQSPNWYLLTNENEEKS